MAPLTRLRARADRVPEPIMAEYYAQRAAVPGTLLISEGTIITPSASGGFEYAPGIWSTEQVSAWKAITDAVHAKGCFIYCQLFAMGRTATTEGAAKDQVEIVAPSSIPMDEESPMPRAMTISEICQSIADFVTAAENAIAAGFDGVECHGANGYLADQFIQDISNQRDDEYGGSVENRSRFFIEVVEGVARAIGPARVGVRLSPWSTIHGMKMDDPIPQFTHLISRANEMGLAYLHLIESRVAGGVDTTGTESLAFAYSLWDGPLLVAGGYNLASAKTLVDEEYSGKSMVVMFGRHFIANPDLVYRIRQGVVLTAYERDTFYTNNSLGYTDYSFSAEYLNTGAA
ncbi:hypothetical protein NQ176_g5724 [Zarea fungicola]|uniref:Uncharacterized protein n=1 Tax=Zarea fungicola TaxID=93591 RepID=A0ACC1N9A6_9HYPO|nr:hypothetical protein NQ176_g5724 [Lecanicillium fungicola]